MAVIIINVTPALDCIGFAGIENLTLEETTVNNGYWGAECGTMVIRDLIIKTLAQRFSWLNFMVEHRVLMDTAFNSIVSKKLYNLKKALKHKYKVPHPVAKKINQYVHHSNNYHHSNTFL